MDSASAMNARDVRAHFSEVLDRAARDEPTVVTRNGREVAAIVPIELLRQYRLWEDQHYARIARERMASPAPGIPMEDLMAEALDADD